MAAAQYHTPLSHQELPLSLPHLQPAPSDPREAIRQAVDHLDHVLPGQAPILNFVHHNTLHGYQHLPFREALESAERLTGIRGYLPDKEFRKFYARGRILDEDLEAALADLAELRPDERLLRVGGRDLLRGEVFRLALLHDIGAITPSRLAWLIEETGALERCQDDLPPQVRERLFGSAAEAEAIGDLWAACLTRLGLDEFALHPEELLDLSIDQAERLLGRFQAGMGHAGDSIPLAHRQMRAEALALLDGVWADVGAGLTLRGLVQRLTGIDVLDTVRPALIRFSASHLDEGLAAWHAPDRGEGLYAAWRRLAIADPEWLLAASTDRRGEVPELPEEPVDAIISELDRLGLPESRRPGYLRRLALELPGWSGLINWRHHRPGYAANAAAPASLLDFLAIRLILDRLALERICRELWAVPATLPALRSHFEKNLSEFLVRQALFEGRLPEYLAAAVQDALAGSQAERHDRESWRSLADMIFTWKHSPVADEPDRHAPCRSGWRLFRLAQHLGLIGADIRALPREDCEALLACLDELTPARRGYVWLCAYERRYREELFNALASNRSRGRWATRDDRPEAQAIFCMDDREEGIRRHLEELNPRVETLGAAGFFGVPINWKGLDDENVTPLCPVVVVPSHEVREVPRPGLRDLKAAHDRRLSFRHQLGVLFNQEVHRNLFSSAALIGLLSPGVLLSLLGKVFLPAGQTRLVAQADARLVPAVPTRLYLTAEHASPATPEKPRLGFTDAEQAERVAAFLRNIGLAYGFGPLVALMGHGSISQNNPHRAAYDCGACSGRHGGPNARAFAAMANRPVVRALLAERGIAIPPDTWFLGAEHNTCNEEIVWYDLEDLPPTVRPAFDKLNAELDRARQLSAHERCRRLASAPRQPDLPQALAHIAGRAADFSQARPELGHATNAAAVVGRRSLSQGVFFDRRVFLISYDPTQDPDGKLLEGLLLAVGPVGAGISLEYYFSTVNNDRYGCGTKVPHNVTGLFGLMEGAASDLRTGLPRQMIEIHEAMRLQLVVECKPEVLGAIYQRQPPLQELIGNGWIKVAAMDPETGVISEFVPERGFVAWEGAIRPLREVGNSPEWYAGKSEPLGPVTIRRADGPA
jgi:uncharacterized protein YbcC (UPF0753/DUF2309 family)